MEELGGNMLEIAERVGVNLNCNCVEGASFDEYSCFMLLIEPIERINEEEYLVSKTFDTPDMFPTEKYMKTAMARQ